MRNFLLSIFIVIALLLPTGSFAQSGDATWLENMGGLETAIGRAWMAPVIWVEETTYTELNEEGTPTFEIGMRSEPASTPVVTDEMQTEVLSALIYEFDSAENAAAGVELFHETQLEQMARDPRSPATNAFDPNLGDLAFGNEGTYTVENEDGEVNEMAVVYLTVQDGELVYQIFGVFLPGNHVEISTTVAEQMLGANAGVADPVYDMNGESTGGLWEKLNAIEIAMPDESTIADLEVYPQPDDAVMGESVPVSEIDIDDLAAVPGLVDSWHITYAPGDTGVMVSTPNVIPHGAFNIELWVMEFEHASYATATGISLSNALIEPLGIVTSEGGGFDAEGMTIVGTGFVRDRSIPEGDAAVVVIVRGSTVYAARVYSNGPAPTPLALDLLNGMQAAEPGAGDELVEGSTASGGMWDVFPVSGDPLLHDLEPVHVEHTDPMPEPVSTPAS